jgi:acyl carrier protein
MYKTGDLAKWRADGNIEYLGRMDFQVKIRGFRIELGEIERGLAAYPGLKECIVTAWEKQPGNVHLVGYVVFEKGIATESKDLQSFLEKSLPEYMVPRIFVFLEALPLSSNGKVDRKALPVPELAPSVAYVAPRNEVEKGLVEIWKEELGLEQVGVNSNFFELGGHSLLLTKVHSRIKKQFDREISLIDMFTHSTISALAKYLAGDGETGSSFKDDERLQKQKEAKLKRKQMYGRG